ncbi:MAG: VacJ family lipoprotein [Alphaproteobacteria bacterium]|nr:VacJ family lipoprotein [Alphaproteobacteria bacterium]
MRRALPQVALAAALALAAADAGAAPQRPPEDYDGTLLDRYSRLIFRFNTGAYWVLDAAAGRLGLPSPAPEGRAREPAAPRAGLGNVASNLVNEPVTALSGLLTGDMATAWRATQRFAINSSVGVLGWYDRAAEWGLEPVHADIGLALCRAGVGEGGYIMLPFVGPRTVRDAIADILLVNAVLLTATGATLGTGAGWQTFFIAESVEIAADVLATRQIDPNAKALTFDDYEAMRRDYLEQRRRRCGLEE